jgi:hypothetical protein
MSDIAGAAIPLIERWAPAYNDPKELFEAAVDHTVFTTPRFREAAMSHRANSAAADAVDTHAVTSAKIAEKTQRAAAVTTGMGSIPRTEAQPRNITRADRQSAMARDIAESFTGP